MQYISSNQKDTQVVLIDRDGDNGEYVASINLDSTFDDPKKELSILTDRGDNITF